MKHKRVRIVLDVDLDLQGASLQKVAEELMSAVKQAMDSDKTLEKTQALIMGYTGAVREVKIQPK